MINIFEGTCREINLPSPVWSVKATSNNKWLLTADSQAEPR